MPHSDMHAFICQEICYSNAETGSVNKTFTFGNIFLEIEKAVNTFSVPDKFFSKNG